ncbi:MAG: hypothetical protein ABI972_01095 [Acidobacteriota bacterium]
MAPIIFRLLETITISSSLSKYALLPAKLTRSLATYIKLEILRERAETLRFLDHLKEVSGYRDCDRFYEGRPHYQAAILTELGTPSEPDKARRQLDRDAGTGAPAVNPGGLEAGREVVVRDSPQQVAEMESPAHEDQEYATRKEDCFM